MSRFDHRAVEDIFATFKRQVPAPLGCSWVLHHERGTAGGTTLSAQDRNGLGPTGVDLQTTWKSSRTAYDALQAMILVSRYLHQRSLEERPSERLPGSRVTGPPLKTFSTLLTKTEQQWAGKRSRPYEIDVSERPKPSRADFTTSHVPATRHGRLRRHQTLPGCPERQGPGSESAQHRLVVIRKRPLQPRPADQQ